VEVVQEELTHEEWETLAALAALDGLSAPERARLETHLTGCEACRRRLAEYGLVADQLLVSVPQAAAPAHLKGRLLDAIRQEASQQQRPAPRPAPPRLRQRLGWWLAAAAVLAALFLGGQNVALQRDLAATRAENARLADLLAAPGSQPLALISPSIEEAAGRFVWAPGHPVGALVVSGLPSTSPQRAYQFWLVRKDGTIDSGGLFRVNADGEAYLPVDAPSPWSNYETMWVTEEPEGGSPEPTGEWLLDGGF
jgi:anti-sigma-K factor RskA